MMNAIAPKWLATIRQEAQQSFTESGFPNTRQENWRYTNVSRIAQKNLPFAQFAAATVSSELINSFKLPDCYHFVLIDGFYHAELSNLPTSVQIRSVKDAVTQHSTLLENKINRDLSSLHGFLAFNTAYFTDGLFLCVPEKTVLDKPIQIIFLSTQEAINATRHFVILEKNSQATLIESFINQTPQTYLSTSVSELFLAENAHLHLYKSQQENHQAYHFGGHYVHQSAQSKLTHHNFALGSLLARHDIISDLESSAECELNGLYLGMHKQHLDNFTRIHHKQPNGISREFYKGILNDNARGVFQGRIVVAENAQKIDSQMTNRNLLLSNHAEIDTKPQLEIYADDVKCSHGVTVGQLDEKSIFYLKSRGIDEQSAKHILTYAFANEMVEKVSFEPLKTRLKTQLLSILPLNEALER
jgi:Fe-S cluster assembly protein SufD